MKALRELIQPAIGVFFCVFLASPTYADKIYVSNFGAHYIEVYSQNGTGSAFATSTSGLLGIAFDNADNLFGANFDANKIEKFDTSGNLSVFADGSSGLNSPSDLVFDADGNLYVANYDGNNILKFDSSGHSSVFAGTFNPMTIVMDREGNLYVTNDGSGTYGSVSKIDSNGNVSVFADSSSGVFAPLGLALDCENNLYVSDVDDNTIQRFDSNGNRTLFADSSAGINGPVFLAFDSVGNLYVGNGGSSTNTIEVFDPGGHWTVFATITSGWPAAIAVDVGDGISRPWRRKYFGCNGTTTNSQSCAHCDSDGTGQDNLFKYVAGLDPTNPASVFALNICAVTNQPALSFGPVVAGRTYTAQFSTDPSGGVWLPLSSYAGPQTNGNQVSITDINATQSNKFYRIKISMP